MKKFIFILSVLLFGFSYGQLKKVEVNKEEVSVIGRVLQKSGMGSEFTKEEFDKYNIKNTIGYLLEYTYEDKVLHRDFIWFSELVYSEKTRIMANLRSIPCFETSSIPQDVSFFLLKTNQWGMRDSVKGECVCYEPTGMFNEGIAVFSTKDYEKYNLIDLAGGKIKLKLYRLEE
ncbi:hypothetical protein [Ornithobacterium rhinotracheale]|uniref:hypothetical protein n=1 Tax=Ornithobacterium rhinotracheale TaxID=28251 RepID=UPI00129CF10E|nr:hypothetical protein [Ornithobacterium rhinotracheale]MRJ09061.1 hypothetical protein [Ornithobacterium rhinotracheale]MRJ11373.1 hypothetical protein [Ornithobacterium rhinotracheale]UOH77833.1 hypothetical protein MT996_11610 [Ornithobacterium rhinotracheale]